MGKSVSRFLAYTSPSCFGDDWFFTTRYFCVPDTGRIADATKELPIAAAAFDPPAVFAFRADRIAGAAATQNLERPISAAARQGGSARWTGWQKVSAVLDMLAAITPVL